MTKVLVLGAGGQIARWGIEMLSGSKDVELTLYLRHVRKLHGKLLDICGDDLKLGVVLYDGTKIVPFGD